MSRWSKNEDDDRPLTIEEFQEMRIAFEREVKRLDATNARYRPGYYVTKKASRRELRYLEMLDMSVDDMFSSKSK